MKKLVVKDDLCIGCGACVAIDSEHFDFDDSGLSSAISNENLESADLRNAMSSCPVNAIRIEEVACNCGENCTCGDNCQCGDNCACK